MPTPDTETLAARLRAVERALTDEATEPEPTSDPVALPPADGPTDHVPGAADPAAADSTDGWTEQDTSSDDSDGSDGLDAAGGPDGLPDPDGPAGPHGTDTTAESGASTETVQRRLCRLEAAVQALRAALDGDDRTRPDATDAVTVQRCPDGDRSGRSTPDGGWPDDLAAE